MRTGAEFDCGRLTLKLAAKLGVLNIGGPLLPGSNPIIARREITKLKMSILDLSSRSDLPVRRAACWESPVPRG